MPHVGLINSISLYHLVPPIVIDRSYFEQALAQFLRSNPSGFDRSRNDPLRHGLTHQAKIGFDINGFEIEAQVI